MIKKIEYSVLIVRDSKDHLFHSLLDLCDAAFCREHRSEISPLRSYIQQCLPSQALEICQNKSNQQPDCILLDWDLSDSNAENFLTQLDDEQIPIVILVSAANEENFIFANQADLNYLVKETLSKELLYLSVRNAIAQTQLKQRLHIAETRLQSYEYPNIEQGDVTYTPYRELNDEISGVVANVRDVGDRQRLEESERTLSNLVENLPGYICRVRNDSSYTTDYVSQGVEVITGYRPEEFLIERSISCYQIIHPDDVDAFVEIVLRAASDRQPYQAEYRIITKSGQHKWMQHQGRGIYAENGDLSFWEGFITDISDRKQAEAELQQLNSELELRVAQRTEALRQSEERWQLALDGSNEGIWDWDVKHGTVFFSKRWKQIRGFAEDEIGNSETEWSSRIHPDDYDVVMAEFAKHFAGETEFLIMEYRVCCKDGSYKWILDRGRGLRDPSGEVVRMVGSETDISDRKIYEAQLLQQAEQQSLLAGVAMRIRSSFNLRDILDITVEEIYQTLQASRVFIYRVFEDGTGSAIAESATSDCSAVLDLTFPKEVFSTESQANYLLGQIYVLNDLETEPVLPSLAKFLRGLEVRAKLVVPIIDRDRLWGLLIAHQCDRPRQWQNWEIELLQQLSYQLAIAIQQANLYRQVQVELADKEKLYGQLISELDQNKVLLKEVHHRVKNNLQVMSSLLRMQFRKTTPELKVLIEEYQNRIQAMALIHAQLHENDNFASINFHDYTANLTANLLQCYGSNSDLIQCNLDIVNISLPLDQSVPLGLIINELVSNSLKHAFPQGFGEIKISLIQLSNQYCLIVADNGCGVPIDFDIRASTSLGLLLVNSLVDQLEAELTYDGGNGAKFTLTFPLL
jgi:PAS domain S-box-containing protein